jgi:hypothetical protein
MPVRLWAHSDRFHERIGDNDLLLAQRSRIPVVSGLGIRLENIAHAGEFGEEFKRGGTRRGPEILPRHSGRRGILEALVNLIFEPAEHGVDQGGGFHLQFGRVNNLIMKESWEKKAQQVDRDGADGALAGQVFAVEMIDATDARVGGEQLVGKLGDRHVHSAEYSTRRVEAEGKTGAALK